MEGFLMLFTGAMAFAAFLVLFISLVMLCIGGTFLEISNTVCNQFGIGGCDMRKNLYKVKIREYERTTGQLAIKVIDGKRQETEEFKKWLKDNCNDSVQQQ